MKGTCLVTKARRKSLVDRDKLNMASKANVAAACVSVFDRIQGWSRENQLLALAASFVLLADASNIPAQDVFTASKNLMADPLTQSGMSPQFQAMRFYLNTEVLN
jgi:hypothetical protein